MTRLLAHRSAGHITHAALGVAVLVHFTWRLLRLACGGRAFVDPGISTLVVARDAALVSLHGLLHASSFLPHVPARRVTTKPMIWPEFRAHNAIFSLRHVACTLLSLCARAAPSLDAPVRVMRWVVVFGAMMSADAVTTRIGSTQDRTTNAMPYPDWTKPDDVRRIKKFYARAQFHATAWAAIGPPTLAWFPLLALELAPLMMTLVRKGLASARMYHAVYGFALWGAYPVLLHSLAVGDDASDPWLIVMGFAASALRIKIGAPKYAVWILACATHIAWRFTYPNFVPPVVLSMTLVAAGGAIFLAHLLHMHLMLVA